jgi:HK97 family phage portal protein
MANIFKRLSDALSGKKSETVHLTQHDTTTIKVNGDFFSFGYGQTGSDQFVKAFGSNPLVYQIVNKIAYTSASIDRIAVNESGETIENSQILELLKRPNKQQAQIDFLETIGQQLSVTGNAYIKYSAGVGGFGAELKVLPSNKIEIKIDNIGDVVGYELERIDGSKKFIEAEEVLHIKTSNIVNLENTSGYYGLSPLQAAWLIVKSSEEIFSAEASIFKNRGIIGILTNETDVPMLAKDRERLQKEFDNEVGGSDRYNSIKISNTKLKYIQTGMSPTDLKLLDGILNKLRLLCSIYGLNSVLFNDTASSTYNNVSEAYKMAYIDSFIPLANKIDRELSRFLSEKLAVNERIKADLSKIDVLKGINKEHSDAITAQLAAGIITEEEARAALEYEN